MKTAREADRSFSDFLIGLELWNFILLWIRITETRVREKHKKTAKKQTLPGRGRTVFLSSVVH